MKPFKIYLKLYVMLQLFLLFFVVTCGLGKLLHTVLQLGDRTIAYGLPSAPMVTSQPLEPTFPMCRGAQTETPQVSSSPD